MGENGLVSAMNSPWENLFKNHSAIPNFFKTNIDCDGDLVWTVYGAIWGHKNIYDCLRIVKEASSNIWNKDLLEGKNPFLVMRKDEFLTSTTV